MIEMHSYNEASFCNDSDFRMMISSLMTDAFINAIIKYVTLCRPNQRRRFWRSQYDASDFDSS